MYELLIISDDKFFTHYKLIYNKRNLFSRCYVSFALQPTMLMASSFLLPPIADTNNREAGTEKKQHKHITYVWRIQRFNFHESDYPATSIH